MRTVNPEVAGSIPVEPAMKTKGCEGVRLAHPLELASTSPQAFIAFAGDFYARPEYARSIRSLSRRVGYGLRAGSLIERWIAVARRGNVVLVLPNAVASGARVLAQLGERSGALDRLREGEQLVEREAASGLAGQSGWAYHALGACMFVARPSR